MHPKLLEAIEDELTPVDLEQLYDEMLDECYSFEKVGGPFKYMLPSRVMSEMLPVDYRCGFNDYVDSRRDEYASFDNGETYYVRRNLEDLIERVAESLEDEATDLENEADEPEVDTEALAQAATLRREAAEIRKTDLV